MGVRMNSILKRVTKAIDAIRSGQMIIIVDDDDREAEGDFVMAANCMDSAAVNFMISHGRGLLCAAMEHTVANRLQLKVQAGAVHDTAFTESVDAIEHTTTGISCADRAIGLQLLANEHAQPHQFARPGHLFPLVAKPHGVLERRGHTEAAVDLCKLAGVPPVAAICEILNSDGTMARTPDLKLLAAQHAMVLLSVEDIVHFRRYHDSKISPGKSALIPTAFGEFHLRCMSDEEHPPLLLSFGDLETTAKPTDPSQLPPLVRIHSECATGDLFGSLRCDCGEQLKLSMKLIAEAGSGVIIYLRQEGRGIGLPAKLQAYALQEAGLDSFDANIELGFKPDEREYTLAARILELYGLTKIRLLTNNPDKLQSLSAQGIQVSECIPLLIDAHQYNEHYLRTKRERFGHKIPERTFS